MTLLLIYLDTFCKIFIELEWAKIYEIHIF